MLDTLLGTKEKMSQTFIEGTRVPLCWIKVGSCVVTQIKEETKDGYWAVQLGFGERRIKNITKPIQGHLRGVIKEKKAPRFLCEVRLEAKPEYKVGDLLKMGDIFKKGDLVSVKGISKGKGFAGVVKRWRFKGGPKTHGQSDRQRAPGAISQGTSPGRIAKGKRMAGRMGGEAKTIKNLIVVDLKPDESMLGVSGPVPGTKGNFLIIKKLSEGKLEELVEQTTQVEVKQGEDVEEKVNIGNEEPKEVKNKEEVD